MIIAVDFDGTIVEHRYPRIGEEIPFAVDTLKLLQQEKHRLILWSVREGALLDEAVEWCKARGLEFYAVNKDYPEEQKGHQGFSRKLKADMFIDDRNLGGLPDWGVIYEMIKEKKTFADIYSQNGEEEKTSLKKKKRWLPFQEADKYQTNKIERIQQFLDLFDIKPGDVDGKEMGKALMDQMKYRKMSDEEFNKIYNEYKGV